MNMNITGFRLPRGFAIRFIAVVLAAIGLGFFYWTSQTKVPEIESQISSKQSEIDINKQIENNLATLYQNMDFYLAETERLKTETEDLLTEFPTFMYLEDKILYADELLKTDLKDCNMSQFSYGQSNYVMNASYSDEKTMELYSVGFSGKYNDLTYVQVKELLDYGLTSPQRFVINSITMAYNEKTGYISGDFSFNTYFISGQQERAYEFPEEVIYGLGNSNRIDDLFGARKTPMNSSNAVEEDVVDNTTETQDQITETILEP